MNLNVWIFSMFSMFPGAVKFLGSGGGDFFDARSIHIP